MRQLQILTALMVMLASLVGATALAGTANAAKPPQSPTPTPTPAPTATSVPCATCPTMHVDSVNINAWYNAGSRGLAAGCYVTVKDAAGSYVDGALVTIRWGGHLSGAATALTALTGGDGGYAEAYFFNSVSGRCQSGDVKVSTCTVTNIYKSGLAYDPTGNVQTTDSDDHCQ